MQIVQQDAFHSPEELSICLVTAVRTALNLTQEQFGKLVGLHPQTISKTERERLRIDNDLQYKLLILREISDIPGMRELIAYMLPRQPGPDVFFAVQALHKVVS